ncbi:trans-aconitate 2-methyltransferase [Mycobacterium sp.]|uniref:class I SAM-dependent methyltransferase n=1 Tax=Mycobacterium sp. TaxID=1785 RepID=UPI0026027C38|nr:class I SAM-dependent methyltransferase [Mycobacterium sp.]
MTRDKASYQGALGHYLSPRRRDPVKTLMEEVVSHKIFASAVRQLRLPVGRPLRVLDIGSGVGDGFALLTQAHGDLAPVTADRRLDYVGLDGDPDMIETATALHPVSEATFRLGDMRDRLPEGDFDLYLSCGVPYSHLTTSEMTEVIANIMRRILASGRRAAIIVDVLGRFSIEWMRNWHSPRWNYAMTFFEDTTERLEQQMTFFDRTSLGEAIAAASRSTGAQPAELGFTDRSILVGRHTATRAFNPAIPPYRTLVNDLARDPSSVSLPELYFEPPTAGAPPEILHFFRALAGSWNELLDQAATGSGKRMRALASALLRCETREQRGLGVGHSLTATVIIDAS